MTKTNVFKKRLLTATGVCLTVRWFAATGLRLAAAQAPATSAAVDELTSHALDPGLARTIQYSGSSIELPKFLEDIGVGAHLTLRATGILQRRRITLFCLRAKLAPLMHNIAQVENGTWRTAAGDTTSWELYQTDDQLAWEKAQIAHSLQYQAHLQQVEQMAMANAVQKELARDPGKDSAVATMLRALTPDQLAQAERASTDRTTVYTSANTQFNCQFLFATQASELPDALQGLITLSAPPGGQKIGSGYGGIVASDNQLRFGLRGPSSPNITIGGLLASDPIPDPSRDVDMQSEVYAAEQGAHLVQIDKYPQAGVLDLELRFPPPVSLCSLPSVLKALFEQTGTTVLAGDYIHSRVCISSRLSADQSYSLRDALASICVPLGQKCVYTGSALVFTSITPGLDLRAEPSDAVVVMHALHERKHTPLTLEDYTLIAGMSAVQLAALVLDEGHGGHSVYGACQSGWCSPVLRLYAALTPAERLRAESPSGLLLIEMDHRSRGLFSALLERGVPPLVRADRLPKRPGLYIMRQGERDKNEIISFLAVVSGSPGALRGYQLLVN